MNVTTRREYILDVLQNNKSILIVDRAEFSSRNFSFPISVPINKILSIYDDYIVIDNYEKWLPWGGFDDYSYVLAVVSYYDGCNLFVTTDRFKGMDDSRIYQIVTDPDKHVNENLYIIKSYKALMLAIEEKMNTAPNPELLPNGVQEHPNVMQGELKLPYERVPQYNEIEYLYSPFNNVNAPQWIR